MDLAPEPAVFPPQGGPASRVTVAGSRGFIMIISMIEGRCGMQSEYLQVVTTVANRAEGEELARHLVGLRLAACVQVSGPINSCYHWQGRLEEAQEYQLFIKSRADLYGVLEAEIKKKHPYETPEIIALPIVAGSADYLAWLDTELGARP
jgi:periplasmic divalent cation tolerance protein